MKHRFLGGWIKLVVLVVCGLGGWKVYDRAVLVRYIPCPTRASLLMMLPGRT